MPRSRYSSGVCLLSSLSGQELVGLSILTIIALPGCIGIDPPKVCLLIEKEFQNYSGWKYCCMKVFNHIPF